MSDNNIFMGNRLLRTIENNITDIHISREWEEKLSIPLESQIKLQPQIESQINMNSPIAIWTQSQINEINELDDIFINETDDLINDPIDDEIKTQFESIEFLNVRFCEA